MPYILYSDDFNDRPKSEIMIGDSKSEWYKIFDRVFKDTNKDYTIKNILTHSKKKRNSILSDVQGHLSNILGSVD